MAKILVTGVMDPFESKDAMKVYAATDKPKYPDFIKKVENWGTIPENGLYKAYAVYECPDDKLHDAIKATHYKILKTCWGSIIKGYKEEYKNSDIVIKKIEEISRRARYAKRDTK